LAEEIAGPVFARLAAIAHFKTVRSSHVIFSLDFFFSVPGFFREMPG
jgi:hypothetical protein